METSCQCAGVGNQHLEEVVRKLHEPHFYNQLADFFKIFNDPTRLKILNLLLVEGLCVCDIALATSMSQSAISHQMKALRNARLVRYERHGKNIKYFLADEHVEGLLTMAMEHIEEGV
ncbi:MAG: ArsR/SmtB family transcription factor [Erysipelotrichaceae bacterium]